MTPQPIAQSVIGSGDRSFRIAFYSGPGAIEAAWRGFEAEAVCTLFQSFRWCEAWCQTAALALGEQPVIVVATDVSGRLAFIMPLAIVRRFGVPTLVWLSQSQSAYNMGLYRADVMDRLGAQELGQLFALISRTFPRLAAVHLTGQPVTWEGHRNPMADLPFEPREQCYAVPLFGDFAAVCASQLSSDKRQDLRRQWRRISEEKCPAIAVAQHETARLDALRRFFDQKTLWVASEGKSNFIDHPAVRLFFEHLACGTARDNPLDIACIEIDGAAISTIKGMQFKDRFYHLNGSIADTPLRRWSLGQLLIHDLIARACANGVKHWDFGPGEGQHKRYWRPVSVQTIDTSLIFRFSGRVVRAIDRSEKALRDTLRRHPKVLKGAKSIYSIAFRAVLRAKHKREPEG
jgi:CelD/BcsL family acetyltransferase involved in cellulose biosynthesis